MTIPSDNILEVFGLTVKFGNMAAVNNVDMKVARNSIVGLVGESGSGKSTLVSAVIGLLPNSANISHGNILFEGTDLTTLPADKFQALRGSHISMVSQDPQSALNPVLTIEQHLTDIQYRDTINKNQKRERAIEALKSVHMPDPEARLSMYPHELSGGQKQRVSIAMAVMMKPKLLIADEPTTALDATLEVEIIELLKELQSSIGCSMIFVTHHLGVVASLCNDVVVMCNGKVEEAGDVHTVFHHSQNQYTQNLLRCDPAQIDEKCRRLPTMNAPDFKMIESKESAKQRIAKDENPILKITNLEVTFKKPFSISHIFNPQQRKDVKAVDKASIHLHRGETLAIVGESGSGKTTLIRAILRLVKAQSGSIIFSGNSVLDANKPMLKKIRTEVALVFQDPVGSLSPRMTVSTSLIEALNQGSQNVADVDEEVARLVQLVGLSDEFLRRYPHELSGGQARRVCIARALAQSPKMLIADEPTAGLDVSIQGEILNLLTELQENLLLPILVVTHNLNVVRHVSDRMVIMYRGKIVEEGLTEQIFSEPKHDYTRHLLDANLHPLPKHLS